MKGSKSSKGRAPRKASKSNGNPTAKAKSSGSYSKKDPKHQF